MQPTEMLSREHLELCACPQPRVSLLHHDAYGRGADEKTAARERHGHRRLIPSQLRILAATFGGTFSFALGGDDLDCGQDLLWLSYDDLFEAGLFEVSTSLPNRNAIAQRFRYL